SGVVAAAGSESSHFQGAFGFGTPSLLNDDLGQGDQVDAVATGASGGRDVYGAGRAGNGRNSRRGNRNRSIFALIGLQFAAYGGKADGRDGDVLKLGLAEDFAKFAFAAGVECF